VLDDMQARLDDNPDAMRLRRSSVEHPYGTIKSWMGATHFLTKGLECVKTEMSLHVLAYNFRRLRAILGIESMMKAIRAYARFLAALAALIWAALRRVLTEKQNKDGGVQRRFLVPAS
jgi:transposase